MLLSRRMLLVKQARSPCIQAVRSAVLRDTAFPRASRSSLAEDKAVRDAFVAALQAVGVVTYGVVASGVGPAGAGRASFAPQSPLAPGFASVLAGGLAGSARTSFAPPPGTPPATRPAQFDSATPMASTIHAAMPSHRHSNHGTRLFTHPAQCGSATQPQPPMHR